MFIKLLLALSALAASVESYHILCVLGIPSKSHNHLAKGIVDALLNAGHEITWVTPFPSKETTPNLHIIDASKTLEIVKHIDMTDRRNAEAGFSFIREFALNISTSVGSIPELRDVVAKKNFDAVISEIFFCDSDAGYAAVLQVPWVLLSGVVYQPTVEALVDAVNSVTIVPMLFNDYPVPMSIWQRATNVAMYMHMLLDNWLNYGVVLQQYDQLFGPLAAARGVALPPLKDALYNVSILFVNQHSSFSPAQSVPPNVIDIGGYHIADHVDPLPKDLQELLDRSTQGVIYFSMGSVLKSSALPANTKTALLEMLGKLPYTVLWKFEEELKGLPNNVHIRPWMPQPAILAHKNTRLFITHGGLLSVLESLRFGVPLVVVPVFGDQPANAARAARDGYALSIKFVKETMADQLKVAVAEAMSNDRYYKRAKYLSTLFNNRPVSPKKLIPYYVELAIETKGAYHLRSKSLLYTWYERNMLDVAAILFFAVLFLIFIVKKIFKRICSSLCRSKEVKSSKKMKRN